MAKPVHYHAGNFPPVKIDWEQLIPLVGPANAAVARYDGALAAVVNPAVLMSPLTTQEAVLSSRIEGTRATMAEVLEYEAKGDTRDLTPEKRGDIQEILNYRKALKRAEVMLAEFPLCLRIVKEAHTILLDGVRGAGKSPGDFRKTSNWIGLAGCTIETATYVPIGADKLPAALGAWENYLHADAPDRLVQMAVIHAEFEALHPFLDGNGRLGRMLVPLFMSQVGIIKKPVFYISSFLEANRDEYYERLLAISRDGDWTGWCLFFLKALKAQAEDNLEKTTQILDLYGSMRNKIADLTRSPYAAKAQDWIFSTPIFKSSDFTKASNIPFAVASRLLKQFRDNGMLTTLQEGAGTKPAVLAFAQLLNIAEGRVAF
jgi:Fic family protein